MRIPWSQVSPNKDSYNKYNTWYSVWTPLDCCPIVIQKPAWHATKKHKKKKTTNQEQVQTKTKLKERETKET